MDKIQAMQVFVRVAEMGSFTRAAESLGLPKASVSRQLQTLENQMGTRLLHRTTRQVQLTHDGQVCYERCIELLSMLDDMDSLFQMEPATLSGKLRVDMSVAMATGFILPRLPEFLQQYPGVEIELSSSDRQVDIVGEGFDCVIRAGELKDSGMIVRPLGTHQMINCASPGYLARFGVPVQSEELSQHAMVHYSQHLGQPSQGFEYFDGKQSHYYPVGGAVTVNSTETYRVACLAGLGIIQVPASGVRPLLLSGQLQEILPQLPAKPMPVSLLYPNRRNVPRRVRVFMEWLSRIVADYLQP